MPQERRVEYIAIDAVKPARRNPKLHAEKQLDASFKRFGFTEPILMDERTGRLVAGHGRLNQLKAMRDGAEDPPPGVRVIVEPKGSVWMVPVVRGWESKNDMEAEAYLLASNRLSEVGGWDQAGLADVLGPIAQAGPLDGLGWTAGEVERMLRFGDDSAADAIPPTPEHTGIMPGDMFKLGKHLLLCGDSTHPDQVADFLGKHEPALMVTDPPYGVEYDPSWRDGMGVSAVRATGKVRNDERIDWTDAFVLFKGPVAYVWHAGIYADIVGASLKTSGFDLRAQIIWAKPTGVFGRGAYHWQHEPCWYAVRKGSKANWVGDRKQTTLWEVATVGGFGSSSDAADASGTEAKSRHGTQKPVELYRRPIINHTEKGQWVYEPFSGSGTALVVCEQLERRCAAIEIEPVYVQQAIDRWEAFSGKKAEKLP